MNTSEKEFLQTKVICETHGSRHFVSLRLKFNKSYVKTCLSVFLRMIVNAVSFAVYLPEYEPSLCNNILLHYTFAYQIFQHSIAI